jgi:hypothetical protein
MVWIGRGAMGDERDVGANDTMMGMAPCQLDCWREMLEDGMDEDVMVVVAAVGPSVLLVILLNILTLSMLSPLLLVEVEKTMVVVSPYPSSSSALMVKVL